MSNSQLNDVTPDKVDIEKYHSTERTEEVRDIIERMPTKFGLWINVIVVFIFFLLVFFGWIVRYPDIVRGQVTINAPIAPIKLVANSSGKLRLNNKISQSEVNSGDIIAYIESSTSFDTLQMIKEIIKDYNPNNPFNTSILFALPSKVALGELTSKYYSFLSSLHQMANFNNDKLYDKQINSLQNLYYHEVNEVNNSSERTSINKTNMEYTEKFLKRDSILFANKVAAEAEFDKAQMEYLNSKMSFSNAQSSQIEAEKQAQQTLSKITEINVQKSEKRKDLEITLFAAYNDLMDNIVLWEQRHLFKSPFKGRVQFLRFWTNDQYVQSGEAVFTIVPDSNGVYGQVALPAIGAGKVKIGQEVIIKLDDFPYNEYGSIAGTISSISLTVSIEKNTQGNNVEIYLVTVIFPKGLTTNYGKPVPFKQESKGIAEVITTDRRLIERLFDNLKYALNE